MLASVAVSQSANIHTGHAQESSPEGDGRRVVDTITGPVEVPNDPQRVVTIDYIIAIAAAELGLIPVGIPQWLPELPADIPSMDDVAVIENDAFEIDLDAIAQLQPDLIIGSDTLDASSRSAPFDELSRIAPTLLFETASDGDAWVRLAAATAGAIGKTAEFDVLSARYDERAETTSETFAPVLERITVDFIDASETEWHLHGPSSAHARVAIDAGFQLGAGVDQHDAFVGYSFDELSLLEGTGALVVRGGEFGSLPVLSGHEAFNALPAVNAGSVITSDYFYVSSFAQSYRLLDELEQGLTLLASR